MANTNNTVFEDDPVHLDLENIDGEEGDHLFEDDPEVEKILEKFKGKQRKKKQETSKLERYTRTRSCGYNLYKQKLIYENMRKVPNT